MMDVAVHAQEDAAPAGVIVTQHVQEAPKAAVFGDALILVETVLAVRDATADVKAEQEAHVVAGATVKDRVPITVAAVLLVVLVPVTTLALLIVWEIVKGPAAIPAAETVAMTAVGNVLIPVVGPVVTHALGPVVTAATLGVHRPARKGVPLALFHVLKAA